MKTPPPLPDSSGPPHDNTVGASPATETMAVLSFGSGVGGLLFSYGGLILSLFFCCAPFGPVLSLLAVVFGHVSRRRIGRAASPLKGRALALAGLSAGYLTLASWCGVILWGGMKKEASGISTIEAQFEPGHWTFLKANRWLMESSPGQVGGNSDEAIELGRDFLKRLSESSDFETIRTRGSLSVWCELRRDRCVILCTDPSVLFEAKSWTGPVRDSAFRAAGDAVRQRIDGPFGLALGIQGLRFYPVVLKGCFHTTPEERLTVDQTLTDFSDSEHVLYRFFSDAPLRNPDGSKAP